VLQTIRASDVFAAAKAAAQKLFVAFAENDLTLTRFTPEGEAIPVDQRWCRSTEWRSELLWQVCGRPDDLRSGNVYATHKADFQRWKQPRDQAGLAEPGATVESVETPATATAGDQAAQPKPTAVESAAPEPTPATDQPIPAPTAPFPPKQTRKTVKRRVRHVREIQPNKGGGQPHPVQKEVKRRLRQALRPPLRFETRADVLDYAMTEILPKAVEAMEKKLGPKVRKPLRKTVKVWVNAVCDTYGPTK
jgi:hypothetical protein